MQPKFMVFRAVSAHFARRVIRRVSLAALIILGAWFIAVGSLAYFYSNWWWLLLIPAVVLGLVFLALRLLAVLITRGIFRTPLTQQQHIAIEEFVDKIERLLDQRQLTPPLIALISLKDLLLHRELRTVKSVIEDSRSLRGDLAALEQKLQS